MSSIGNSIIVLTLLFLLLRYGTLITLKLIAHVFARIPTLCTNKIAIRVFKIIRWIEKEIKYVKQI